MELLQWIGWSKSKKEVSQLLLGADSVIMPNKIGGDHMASLVVDIIIKKISGKSLTVECSILKVAVSSYYGIDPLQFYTILKDKEKLRLNSSQLYEQVNEHSYLDKVS